MYSVSGITQLQSCILLFWSVCFRNFAAVCAEDPKTCLLCKVYNRFLRLILKPNTDCIQFLFSKHSARQFSFLSTNDMSNITVL